MKTLTWPDCSACSTGRPTPTRAEGAALTLSVADAAALLGIGKSLAYDLVRRNEIPHVLLGTAIRIPRRSLEAWLEEKAQPSAHRRGGRR